MPSEELLELTKLTAGSSRLRGLTLFDGPLPDLQKFPSEPLGKDLETRDFLLVAFSACIGDHSSQFMPTLWLFSQSQSM